MFQAPLSVRISELNTSLVHTCSSENKCIEASASCHFFVTVIPQLYYFLELQSVLLEKIITTRSRHRWYYLLKSVILQNLQKFCTTDRLNLNVADDIEGDFALTFNSNCTFLNTSLSGIISQLGSQVILYRSPDCQYRMKILNLRFPVDAMITLRGSQNRTVLFI